MELKNLGLRQKGMRGAFPYLSQYSKRLVSPEIMRHLPFIACIVFGAVAVFIGYVVRFPVYFAWLIGVGGSLCTFIGAFTWLLLRAPGERRGPLFLSAGFLTAVGYLPLHSALSEGLKSADLHVRVSGHMEFAFFAIPTLIAGLSIFHGVRLLSEKKKPSKPT